MVYLIEMKKKLYKLLSYYNVQQFPLFLFQHIFLQHNEHFIITYFCKFPPCGIIIFYQIMFFSNLFFFFLHYDPLHMLNYPQRYTNHWFIISDLIKGVHEICWAHSCSSKVNQLVFYTCYDLRSCATFKMNITTSVLVRLYKLEPWQ